MGERWENTVKGEMFKERYQMRIHTGMFILPQAVYLF